MNNFDKQVDREFRQYYDKLDELRESIFVWSGVPDNIDELVKEMINNE